jgi:hypothetical protein
MLFKVFNLQWNNPGRDDWAVQVRVDLKDFNMGDSLDELRKQSQAQFKQLVKRKAQEFEFPRLMKLKLKHESKMGNLNYSKLDMQKYLYSGNLDKNSAQTIFRYRVRMADYGENFRGPNGPRMCPICGLHLDNQIMSFYNCQAIRTKIQVKGEYSDIFKPTIPIDLVNTLVNIDEFRENFKAENT